jgi:hypothetical protein
MEPEGSLPHSQQSASYPYPETYQTSQRPTIPFQLGSLLMLLGAFAKGFVMSSCRSVCLSAWNNWAPTGRISIKIDILGLFAKYFGKIQFGVVSDKNNSYFTRRPMQSFDKISLNSSQGGKRFRQKL